MVFQNNTLIYVYYLFMQINSNLYSEKISNPSRLHSYDEIFSRDFKSIPTTSGIYCWYFKTIPPQLLSHSGINKCHKYEDKTLLYIGKANNLRTRIKNHTGYFPEGKFYPDVNNASRSTLRLSLGVLLYTEKHSLKTGKDGRVTFCREGELKLNEWMSDNASVVFIETNLEETIKIENLLINTFFTPLNNQHNKELEKLRTLKKKEAKTKIC